MSVLLLKTLLVKLSAHTLQLPLALRTRKSIEAGHSQKNPPLNLPRRGGTYPWVDDDCSWFKVVPRPWMQSLTLEHPVGIYCGVCQHLIRIRPGEG